MKVKVIESNEMLEKRGLTIDKEYEVIDKVYFQDKVLLYIVKNDQGKSMSIYPTSVEKVLNEECNKKCKEETIQDSKEYKEMQDEIERRYTYECAKAYFTLNQANDSMREKIPITLQENEILVFVDGYAFAVSFDDVGRYLAISDADILEICEDDKGREYFQQVEYQDYAFQDLLGNAIEFMEGC